MSITTQHRTPTPSHEAVRNASWARSICSPHIMPLVSHTGNLVVKRRRMVPPGRFHDSYGIRCT